MNETLAQVLRGSLYDNPLYLIEGNQGSVIRKYFSDPDLDIAAKKIAKRIAPKCPFCNQSMTFMDANDFEGWSCTKTINCTFHLSTQTNP